MPERAIRAEQAKSLAKTTDAEAAPAARPRPGGDVEKARRFAIECARSAAGDHCENIVVLDLAGVSPICDFFVIATGTSDRQMRATGDHIESMGKAQGEKPYGVSGYSEGTWIVVDYVDVVIHLFGADLRSYYDLESLWGDRPLVDWAPRDTSQPV